MQALKVHASRVTFSVLGLLFYVFLPFRGYGQSEQDNGAILTFSHPSIGQYYLDVVFLGDIVFLPLGELLSLTGISSVPTTRKFGFQGYYPSSNEKWEIDPLAGIISFQGRSEKLTANDFYLGEQELYLHPRFFSKIFGLEFSVNKLKLSISMNTERVLPIEEKRKREAQRKLVQTRREGLEDVNLMFPLNREIFGFGTLDYNVNMDHTSRGSNLGLQMKTGTALFWGDFQANLNLKRNNDGYVSSFSGVKWRYVFPSGFSSEKNSLLGSVELGQIYGSSNSSNYSLLGFAITNNPIIPRRSLSSFVIDGYTEKDSEVELLIGGQLVEFMKADERGYYRFNTPVNYGTVRLTLRIYTPQGEILIQERQLQIPFSYLPKGFVSYNLKGGSLINSPDSLSSNLITHGDISVGVTNFITIRGGLDYGEFFGPDKVAALLGISTRLFQKYLLDFEFLPSQYLRFTANVFYANNINVSGRIKNYLGLPPNLTGSLMPVRDANLNVFIPFKLYGKYSGIRFGGEKIWLLNGYKGNFQIDYNLQLGRVATRTNYRAQLFGFKKSYDLDKEISSGMLSSSFTYSLPRSLSLPGFIKGLYLRTHAEFIAKSFKFATINFQLSQTFLKSGRFSLSFNRNILNKSGAFQIGFLYDFSFIRSASQFTGQKINYSLRQTLSGSLALDGQSGKLLTSNREQVSQSGVSIRMFVDQNDNGSFDSGEEIIPAKAVRLDKSANMLLGSDGILRITQLQSYWMYKLEVVLNDLPDPTLSPKEKIFGFIADPNRFKSIDIPLYRTGIIEGTISRETPEGLLGVGGLRIILQRIGDAEPLETIRTFSDGGFYAFGLLPGKYTLHVDPKQLEFMEVSANPDKLEFEIKALADGDYLEGINVVLGPKSESIK